MNRLAYAVSFLAMLTFAIFAAGCSGPATSDKGGDSHADEQAHADHDHGEEHAGPHGGQVIDIGRSHAYHAEIVEDEADSMVTVYLLDKDLKEMPITETTLTMNLLVDGEARTYELIAMSDGDSSEFKAKDAGLFEALHKQNATGKLLVTIDGKPYTGEVTPHDHAEHGHAQ